MPDPSKIPMNGTSAPRMGYALPLIGPPGVMPHPTATFFQVAHIDFGPNHGGPRVALQVATPSGVDMYFISPDAATTLSELIAEMARQAKSGIVIAGPGLVQS